jgi:hypothetical protein
MISVTTRSVDSLHRSRRRRFGATQPP